MRVPKLAVVGVTLCVLFCFLGCKKEAPTSAPPPPPKKPVAVKQQQASSVRAENLTQAFDFSLRRDPFKPYVVELKPDEKRSTGKNLLPIQTYELSQFRVTGIIVGLKDNFAQVVDPSGKAYTLKKGMSIGNKDGRVVTIAPGYIEVVERVVEDSGRVKNRTERLVIQKKK